MVKILLVEDEEMWQEGIALLLAEESDMNLIATVDNADDAEFIFERENPDIVLVDWKIKGAKDGLELAKSLDNRIDPERIILVTGSPAEQLPINPYGYVPKARLATDLIPQILQRISCLKNLA